MMRITSFALATPGRMVTAALLALLLCGAALASDDPPGRVARVNLLDGRGAMQPAGTDAWVSDLINRPLTGGDKLWIEAGSRAELHIGSTALRLGERTALQILIVDDGQVRLRVTAGSVNLRVRALEPDERFDIETPAGEIAILQPGGYRLDVEDQDERGQFAVWSGLAEVSGNTGSRRVGSNESVELIGGNEPAIELAAAGTPDSLDLWAEDRDRREDESRSARYVSRDVVGYEELDGYGDWTVDPVYGSVWVPQLVVVDWAPYRFGRWDWIGPWGWTWIDDAPWGFAPCHYGRWVHMQRGWGWAPGARSWRRPVYAPALVAWRGDRYPRHEPGMDKAPRVGWVPLGYNEIYEPPFHASRNYLRAANLSNTRLGHGEVDRYLEERQSAGGRSPERRYANAAVPGALTMVSRDTFTSAARVDRNRLPADAGPAQSAPLSTRGLDIPRSARTAGRAVPADRPELRPDPAVFERPVIRAAPGASARRRVAGGEQLPGRAPPPQRGPQPAAAPAATLTTPPTAPPAMRPLEPARPLDRREEDRPASRQRGIGPAPIAPAPASDRPAAPPRELQPRYQPRADYRPSQPAPAGPSERYAPAQRSTPAERSAPAGRSAPAERPAPSAPPASSSSGRAERGSDGRGERGKRD